MARVFRHLFQHIRRQERRMGRQYPSLSEHHLVSDCWFLIGISILDLLLDLPPTARHGHFGVHPIRFRSQRPDPISRPSCDRLCFPHELHRTQRMAFRRVRRTNAEYCCCAWCPEFVRVFFFTPPVTYVNLKRISKIAFASARAVSWVCSRF